MLVSSSCVYFFHLCEMSGDESSADAAYIIRDHDRQKFEQRKAIFAAAAEQESLTRAAELLHLTQSTVSTHIQSLEQELDSQLILRGARRKLELTETGRRVYAAAKEILNRC